MERKWKISASKNSFHDLKTNRVYYIEESRAGSYFSEYHYDSYDWDEDDMKPVKSANMNDVYATALQKSENYDKLRDIVCGLLLFNPSVANSFYSMLKNNE